MPTKSSKEEEHGGKIESLTGELALISIAPEVLLQPVRDSLSIDRRKLTFRQNHVQKIKELACQHLITIEHLLEPQEVMATFPLSELPIVTAIVKNRPLK